MFRTHSTPIRVANMNHRNRREDFERLVREVIRLGNEVIANTDIARCRPIDEPWS